MMDVPSSALLIVISGPSGAGKTTLCDRLVAEHEAAVYSISCTTRPPRPGEVHGRNYHFLDEETFQRYDDQGAFLEHANVHGFRYGTLSQAVRDALASGSDVMMDIDVQGAAQIRRAAANPHVGAPLGDSFVDIFVAPPSMDTLEKRLRGRAQDDQATIDRRLENARMEMRHWTDYQYLIVNNELSHSYEVLQSIVVAEHHRIRSERGAEDVQ